MYMWQSQVEIERYFVAFSTALPRSKHCSAELLLKAGLIRYVDLHVSGIHASTLSYMSPTLSRSSALLRFKRDKYGME